MSGTGTPSPDVSRFFDQLGAALKLLRGRAGLTGAELARRAGVGRSQLSKYETGKAKPPIAGLARLLSALEAEPLHLFHLMHQLGSAAATPPEGDLQTARSPAEGADPELAGALMQFLSGWSNLFRTLASRGARRERPL